MLWAILLVGVTAVAYLYFSKKFSFFKNHGIPYEPGYFPLGSSVSWKLLSGKLSFVRLTDEYYKKHSKEKWVGYYGTLGDPVLLIRDIELGKRVMIKDFDYFVDRRPISMNKEANKIFANMLTTLEGDEWKAMRSITSPIFTSGRLKLMVPIVNKVCHDMTTYTGEMIKESKIVDTKELFSSFAFEVIMSTGFGVDINAWNDKENIVKKNAWIYMGYAGNTVKLMTKFIISFFVPFILEKTNIRIFDGNAEDFLVNLMKQVIEQRKSGKAPKRNDLVDLFIQALDEASLIQSDDEKAKSSAAILSKMSEDKKETMMIAQSMIMFLAAFDTSSTGLSLVCHFLATNPDCQEKLLEEINSTIDDNDGNEDLSWEQIEKMEYTEAILLESMRMYNFVGAIERVCTKDYPVPDMNFTIPKGMIVQVANFMSDDEFYPDAETFNPERFIGESKQNAHSYAYTVFGHGPRKCIGMRFAMMNMKLSLIHMVRNFKILSCEKTVKDLDPDPMNISQLPKGGLYVAMEARV